MFIRKPHLSMCLASTVLIGLAGCAGTGGEDSASRSAAVAEPASPAIPAVDIEATEYGFAAPPSFPSGWVRLRFINAGKQTHFLLLWRLPAGKSFDDYAEQVAGRFADLYKDYRAGRMERDAFLDRLGKSLPEWFGTVQRMGGAGFTAPGHTSETTVRLEPGDYVMECYVRSAEKSDAFHGSLGMLRPLIVTGEDSGAGPPEADTEIVLSNYAIAVHGEPTPGKHTVHVRVEENPDGLILHNVHLARLEDGVSAQDAAAWLDWVDAMLPPAPAEFLGGAEQALAGSESYVTVRLEPGRYAWISEAWGPRGMIHEFTVN